MNCYTIVRGWQWQFVAFELFTGLSTCISYTARGIVVFLAVGKSDSSLANVWTSARRWPTRALPSTSPSIWVQLSPSPLRQRTRVWTRTVQARPRRRQARLPSGEMPGARRPSWKEAKPCTCTCVHKCNICGNGFKSEAGVKIHKGKTHKNEELPEDY